MEYILLLIAIFMIMPVCGWLCQRYMKDDDEEINESYCEVCVQWSECNGADDECQWRE